VIEVSGRTYPVEVRYRPLVREEEGEEQEKDTLTGVAEAVEELSRLGAGDVLVFLPTERDILEAAHQLRGPVRGKGAEILPLYARLSTAEQNRVFQPHGGRRIVLATNVAESSLTVPGIRYVVDSGTARISRYSARSKVQRLPIEPVSQASADQRKGAAAESGRACAFASIAKTIFSAASASRRQKSSGRTWRR
jgi:ATP-dependent helicase HrpA